MFYSMRLFVLAYVVFVSAVTLLGPRPAVAQVRDQLFFGVDVVYSRSNTIWQPLVAGATPDYSTALGPAGGLYAQYRRYYGNGVFVGGWAGVYASTAKGNLSFTEYENYRLGFNLDGQIGISNGPSNWYVFAGWASAKVTLTDDGRSDTHQLYGGSVGLGLEYNLSSVWSAGTQLRFTEYGSKTFDTGYLVDYKAREQSARVYLSYKVWEGIR